MPIALRGYAYGYAVVGNRTLRDCHVASLVLCLGWNVRLIVSLPRRYDVMTLRKHIYRFPQRHNAITWYVKTFRNVNYVR